MLALQARLLGYPVSFGGCNSFHYLIRPLDGGRFVAANVCIYLWRCRYFLFLGVVFSLLHLLADTKSYSGTNQTSKDYSSETEADALDHVVTSDV